jgi:site-specific DNA-methyltransferase (adenine-specific)
MNKYTTFKTSELTQFLRRDVRTDVLEQLKERIVKGYNPARPLTIVQKDGKNIVADGNHRLQVLKDLGIEEVPCVIREGNEYSISIECNSDEDTFAPEDLFDRLQTIQALKNEGHTQQEIGDIMGMSRTSVANYYLLIDKIVTNILDLCKSYQQGRVTSNVTFVTFNFTEGWFRNSGLYELNEEYQARVMNEFIEDKFNWNSSKLKQTSEKYKLWISMEELAAESLHDKAALDEVKNMIQKGTFQTLQKLNVKIEEYNKDAQNKLIQGDCLTELNKLDDGIIDVVITDPPYGMNYKSNFSKYTNHVTKQGVANDDDSAIQLFDDCCEILNRKTKDDAHLYFFIDINNYPIFRAIAEKYFDVKTTLIWYKSDAGIGDLKYDWINGTEFIIYCTKGKRPVNKRRVNVLKYDRLHSSEMIHPTQKPEGLITEILTVSANKKDMFCDPFMGSGSHVAAAKKYGCNYIGIELDNDMYNKAKSNIN